jgi:hypothetical protein
MRQLLRGGGAVLILALAAPLSAAAQVRGLPVYNSGVPTGLGLYGDIAFPNDDAGGGTTLAGSARLGLGPVGVTGTLAHLDGEGASPNVTSVGGTLNYKVFGGPLIPFSATLQGGLGYAKLPVGFGGLATEVKQYRFPVGLGLALTIPNPVLAIKPWVAPRIDIVRDSPLGGPASTETNFGISAGVEFNLLTGLGLHAAYDRVSAGALKPSSFAVGLHYGLRIPGL